MKHWNLFIVIINTKSYFIYIILTRDDLHNFSKTNWLDNFDRHVYYKKNLKFCYILA